MKDFLSVCMLALFPWTTWSQAAAELIVCGDDQVMVFDVAKSTDTIPEVTWRWKASEATDLPDNYRAQYFRSIDECKPVHEGSRLLITSSSGGVALIDKGTKKVLFYAWVGNAHSVELLPGDRIIVAASTHEQGNRIELYDISRSETPLFQDSLYSGHGVVWDANRELLYALGYDELRAYRLSNWDTPTPSLTRQSAWRIPGEGGHDLSALPNDSDKLLLTEHGSVWLFDKATGTFDPFTPLKGSADVKSVSFHPRTDQVAFIQAEISWWSHRVYLLDPDQWFSFPEVRLYKVRWLAEEAK